MLYNQTIMMKKKFLVTGGTGFIGSAVVKSLIRKDYQVKILDNQSRGALRRLKNFENDFEFIKGDIRDLNTVIKATKNVDSIIHLAYVNGTEFFYSMPEVVLDVGVKGMINVIDAATKNNISELFLASSSEVYATPQKIPTSEEVPMVIPDPLNPRFSYSGGKIISELMTINYGRKFFKRAIIFRPHNVYGPDMGWEHILPQFVLRMKALIEKSPDKHVLDFSIQGTGAETRAFIYIDDFAAAFMKLVEKGEHLNIYNIGVQKETSIRSIADEVAAYFKKQVKIIPSKLSAGSTPRRCPDITKIKKLGFLPKSSLSEGVKITTTWYDKNYSKYSTGHLE